jgi:hypothetical protein
MPRIRSFLAVWDVVVAEGSALLSLWSLMSRVSVLPLAVLFLVSLQYSRVRSDARPLRLSLIRDRSLPAEIRSRIPLVPGRQDDQSTVECGVSCCRVCGRRSKCPHPAQHGSQRTQPAPRRRLQFNDIH